MKIYSVKESNSVKFESLITGSWEEKAPAIYQTTPFTLELDRNRFFIGTFHNTDSTVALIIKLKFEKDNKTIWMDKEKFKDIALVVVKKDMIVLKGR